MHGGRGMISQSMAQACLTMSLSDRSLHIRSCHCPIGPTSIQLTTPYLVGHTWSRHISFGQVIVWFTVYMFIWSDNLWLNVPVIFTCVLKILFSFCNLSYLREFFLS